ncbi:tRNA (N6-isopentenyl adenosine(37)-C2)-methylthiotransferase MiaB [Chryseobacterium carnipullorum]|uniref:tRNA-2-methylthio-N(6)-dimethylallyladenosine synthase n=1 Tax=Chryseobacterium carnipullorum TaxID=1124835 RepID=A0A1M7A6I9_CHRCU|nr:tRNA (N6-isopentenyl adenosine(37)-C2)-methylthiotransferase MiaB [Chryseobacterium carnipullorum]MDN5395589.1 tRNA (N6-isopentenyl adenosine(37)-C2)-methylthiotransferase MiaB [Chryseobacterium sp.]AZA51295.1 tRNA (N6-isopentenyl adenosine(37)-C2)-methylthiotransferase MiaB [Chryseobacterium carnipullorum]AZA67887.1 tRNA (N6-isopentenyl adenosine(37)-C2)-methylthiotransferase MiaB [Chryseobacterium carnipullorum]MDN5421806.1 tRNA (N6-isopentenyl adenosine(37)-C2)-methylthiotransferase MiaB 
MQEKYIDETKQGEAFAIAERPENSKKLFLESYGCQMNFSDSEIVASILNEQGYNTTLKVEEADLILLNTCSIREKAEQTVRMRLAQFKNLKKQKPNMTVGVLGCMAERLKTKFLEEEQLVDLVVGPDAYRDLPNLLKETEDGRDAINVILSKEETYADINPVRLGGNGVTAFVTITRGCDNMCTFCVVPFTRGRERSRDPHSIIQECKNLLDNGYKEITLLGQNVDSYLWYGGGPKKDFVKASEMQKATAVDFAHLLDLVAKAVPEMRIRFSTSNPQDMSLDVFRMIAKHDNICNYVHLPVQSGSNNMLLAMNRQHTREEYLDLIKKAKEIVPDIAFSQDMIIGFCNETEEDHQDTLSLMKEVEYDYGYMFAYSERPGTPAHKKMEDNIPFEVKQKRLNEVIELQRELSRKRMETYVGRTHQILIEGTSRKNKNQWKGRNSQNAVCVFDVLEGQKIGDIVNVFVYDNTQGTLLGRTAE